MKQENKIGIVITCRVNSNRLYQKALQTINGKTCIEILLDHLINDKYEVILAIPESPEDDILAQIATDKGVAIYRGEDQSPLHRLYECALQNDFDHVVRITADDILIDLPLLFLQVDFHLKGNRDYTYMSRCPEGIAGEVFSVRALEQIVDTVGDKPIEFTSYYVKHPEFNWIEFYPPYEYQYSFRLTMDYEEDLILLRTLFALLKKPGTLDFINLLKQNKYLLQINHLPKVTIFTPIYNTEKYIIRTIESVIKQSFRDYEYILIDDGSTDDSVKRILEYVDTLRVHEQAKIKIIRNKENKGQSYTSNKALEMARGKYIMCLDSDDTLEPDALKIMVDILNQEYSDMVITGYNRIDEDCNVIDTCLQNDKHLGCALIYKRVINELKFKEGIKYQMGTEFLERLKNNCTINYLHDVLWNYRQREGSLTTKEDHPENV